MIRRRHVYAASDSEEREFIRDVDLMNAETFLEDFARKLFGVRSKVVANEADGVFTVAGVIPGAKPGVDVWTQLRAAYNVANRRGYYDYDKDERIPLFSSDLNMYARRKVDFTGMRCGVESYLAGTGAGHPWLYVVVTDNGYAVTATATIGVPVS